MYPGIKADIERVFQWLQGADEAQWDAQTAMLSDAISDAMLMMLPLARPGRIGTRSQELPSLIPGTKELSTALPHLREMFRSVPHRNRAAALESGRMALSSLT